MSSLAAAKRCLRQQLDRRCRAIAQDRAEAAAQAVARHLAGSQAFQTAGRVALYADLPGELGTGPLYRLVLESGKVPLFPRMVPGRRLEFAPCPRWEELQPGRYGVLEPPPERVSVALKFGDLVCVPGLAFDRWGNRLGRGKGYYDRSFAGWDGAGPRLLGLAYDLQLLDQVPHGPEDHLVDGVVTESGVQHREGSDR